MDDLDTLWTENEYADYIHKSPRSVQRERWYGNGCRYVKIGRAVRYRKRDVIEFIERHLRHSTSENINSPLPRTAEAADRVPNRQNGGETPAP